MLLLGRIQLGECSDILSEAGAMAKYKSYDYSQSVMIPASLEDQLMIRSITSPAWNGFRWMYRTSSFRYASSSHTIEL
jgi:hypothetical protein